MFRRLFGQSKSKEKDSSSGLINENKKTIETINQLKDTEDIIDKKINKFNEDIFQLHSNIKISLNKTNPDRIYAIKLLKRIKILEQQRDQLYQIKDNILSVNQQVQNSHFNQQITHSLHIGQQQLKLSQKDISTKKIEDIIDNLHEQFDISNEINQLLSTSIDHNHQLSNNISLENELNQFIIEDNLTSINLPNPPSQTIHKHISHQEIKQFQQLTNDSTFIHSS